MPLLTSYKWKTYELNDGINYLVPLVDSAFDNQNSVETQYAYRGTNVPVQMGITMREAVFPLNINVVATSNADFENKVKVLRQLFRTNDPTHYPLSRKKPHEQYYSYLECAPREFLVDPINRRVSITLTAADKTWKSDDWITARFDPVFNGTTAEVHNVVYDGSIPVEPIVEITPITPGAAGPTPLYFQRLNVWTHGTEHILNQPFKLITNWNISTLVSAGKMKSGGADIKVRLADGTDLPVHTEGPDTALNVWIKPHVWPDKPALFLGRYPFGDDNGLGFRDGFNVWTFFTLDRFPVLNYGETVKIENEYLTLDTYNSIADPMYKRFFAYYSARGVSGSVAVNHAVNMPILQANEVVLTFGYAAGFEQYHNNDLTGWPPIDYINSSNTLWIQKNGTAPLLTNGQPRHPFYWEAANSVGSDMGVIYFANDNYPSQYEGYAALGQYKVSAGERGFRRRRLFSAPPSVNRLITGIQLKLKVTTVGAGYLVAKVTAPSGRLGTTFEQTRTLWQANVSGNETIVDTGLLPTNPETYGSLFFALELDGPNSTTTNGVVEITEVRYQWDSNVYARVPTMTPITAIQGTDEGYFPVSITIDNLNDPADRFTVQTRAKVNDLITIDADARTVTGANLKDTTYTNPIWVRLQPGINQIQLSSVAGTGQFIVTLKWKNRY